MVVIKRNKEIAGAKLFILVITLISVALLSGCQEPVHRETIEMRDLSEAMAERQQTKLEYIRENAKPDFERHYGEGRYEKDFSELNYQASEIFKNGIIEDLKQIQEGEYFVIGDVEFFNDSLEKVENGELSLEELPANTLDHAKECELIVYVFVEDIHGEVVSIRASYLRDLADEFSRGVARNPSITIKVFDDEVLNQLDIGDLKLNENRDLVLMSSDVEKAILRCDDTFSWWDTGDIPMNPIEALEKKYNEEFIILYPIRKVNSGYMVCAPKRDISLAFTDGSGDLEGDRYLNVLAQKLFKEKIDEIIKSYGAEDRIVYYLALGNCGYTMFSTNTINSIDSFVTEDNSLSIEVTLYYLKSSDEKEDLELIHNVFRDIRKLTAGLNVERNSGWVRIFELEVPHIKYVVELFKSEGLMATDMRERKTLFKLETLHEDDADNDAFNYLYTYGTELGYTYAINETFTDRFSVEYFEKNRRRGVWR